MVSWLARYPVSLFFNHHAWKDVNQRYSATFHVRFVTTFLPPRWTIWGGHAAGSFRSYHIAWPLVNQEKGLDSRAPSKIDSVEVHLETVDQSNSNTLQARPNPNPLDQFARSREIKKNLECGDLIPDEIYLHGCAPSFMSSSLVLMCVFQDYVMLPFSVGLQVLCPSRGLSIIEHVSLHKGQLLDTPRVSIDTWNSRCPELYSFHDHPTLIRAVTGTHNPFSSLVVETSRRYPNVPAKYLQIFPVFPVSHILSETSFKWSFTCRSVLYSNGRA